MKLRIIILIVVAVVLLTVASFYVLKPTGPIVKPKPVEKINLVFMHTGWSYAVKWSVDNKLVEFPENVEIKIVSPEVYNNMFISGDADIGMVSLPAFILAWNQNNNWGILYPHGRSYNLIVAREDSGITSLKDLKGKTIAVGGLKFMTTFILLDMLEKYNITSDYITLIAKPLPVIPQLVKTKDVDAGLLTIRDIPLIEELKLKTVVDLDEEYIKSYGVHAIPVVIVAKKNLDAKSVKKVVNSLNKALEIAYEHSDEVIKSYYEVHGGNLTAELNVYKVKGFKIFVPWDKNKKIVIKHLFELCKKYGVAEKIPNLEDVIIEI